MAGLRSKMTLPVGSARWIANERGSVLQMVQQEVDEFPFSVSNEMDWLNEHMAEIFNKNPMFVLFRSMPIWLLLTPVSDRSITEVFKTPGKLRGKTPRTVRRGNALESRAPLTDIFAPNVKASVAVSEHALSKPAEHVTGYARVQQPVRADAAPAKQQGKSSRPGKENIDSGYHGTSTEDDSEAERALRASLAAVASQDRPNTADSRDTVPISYPDIMVNVDDHPATGQSHSMPKVQRATSHEEPDLYPRDTQVPDVHEAAAYAAREMDLQVGIQLPARDATVASAPLMVAEDVDRQSARDEPAQETAASSQRSSPAAQVVRKSSLSFATLPAREPLAPKISIDHAVSHSAHLNVASLDAGRTGASMGHATASTIQAGPFTHTDAVAIEDRMDVDEDEKHVASEKDSEDLTLTRLHRKTSTQRLHERISQLGQSQASRPTKSIPSLVHPASQPEVLERASPVAPEIAAVAIEPSVAHQEHITIDEDAWMSPRKPVALPDRARFDAAYSSSSESQSAMYPTIQTDEMDIDVPAPTVSRAEAVVEGSQQIEAASTRQESPSTVASVPVAAATATAYVQPVAAAGPCRPAYTGSMRPPAAAKPLPKSNADGPLTASKAKLSSILKSARGIFASSAGVSAQAKMETMSPATTMRLRSQTNHVPREAVVPEVESQDEAVSAEVAQPKALEEEEPQSQPEEAVSKAKESKRPMRPAKAAASKAKPVPVAIKVGTASQRELDNRKVNPPNASLASNLQQSLAPVAPPTRQAAAKTGAASLRKVTSNSSLRSTAANSGRPRALAAAARKKEQDEQEAQRKLEAKKEMERKKAASQEEDRRKEQQRKEMEMQRQQEQRSQAEDAKKAAKRQEIERRRLENARKQEQQRGLQMHTRARAGNEPQPVVQVQMPPPRGDLNGARTVSKMTTASNVRGLPEVNHPHMNPARPAKRGAPVEEAEDRAHGPPARTGQAYVQIEAKRRHTNDEDEVVGGRQAMPPPMRQSTLRKDVPNKAFLAQAYMNASSSQTSQLQGGISTIKLTTPQHAPQMKASHALDMNKFATAKIPFAENSGNNNGFSNATIAAATATATSAVASASAASAAALGKTPAGGVTRQNQAARSSPQYREGDAISLPEIPTDSEDDEDDDDGVGKDFNVPDWAQSPALRQLLEAQQLIDPEQVFGPIAPLHMEEIFKNKDRHHRFRNRTSSANWSGQDRLTQEEIQRDLEARRRLIANGEWSYGMGMS